MGSLRSLRSLFQTTFVSRGPSSTGGQSPPNDYDEVSCRVRLNFWSSFSKQAYASCGFGLYSGQDRRHFHSVCTEYLFWFIVSTESSYKTGSSARTYRRTHRPPYGRQVAWR